MSHPSVTLYIKIHFIYTQVFASFGKKDNKLFGLCLQFRKYEALDTVNNTSQTRLLYKSSI